MKPGGLVTNEKNFVGFNPVQTSPDLCGITRTPQPPAERLTSPSLPVFISTWNKARRDELLKMFELVASAEASGVPVNRALRGVGRRRFGGKRLGFQRCRALYYQHRREQNADCLFLKWKQGEPPLTVELLQTFVRACENPGVSSFGKAHVLLNSPGVTLERFITALPENVRIGLKQIFAQRRIGLDAVRAADRELQATIKRQLRNESKRAARVRKLAGEIAP